MLLVSNLAFAREGEKMLRVVRFVMLGVVALLMRVVTPKRRPMEDCLALRSSSPVMG